MRTVLGLIVLVLAQPCLARRGAAQDGQDGRPDRMGEEGWQVTLGAAPVVTPAWEGARDMAVALFPDLRIAYGDVFFASIPEGMGLNLVEEGGWKAGPLAKIRFGRDEDGSGSPFILSGSSAALAGPGDVGATAELGGFVERRFGAREEWRARLEARRGIGGHEGVVAEGSLAYRLRAGRMILTAGPGATVASRDFTQTYFGIDDRQSARSGLAPYRAEGGLVSVRVGGTLVRPLGRRSAITGFASLKRLTDAATASPLLKERGRALQLSLGVGYGYRFGL